MISKVYENKYGLIKWNCITSDLEVAKTDTIYLANKATGSLIINIQEPSNSLIWNNENKEWIPYAVNGEGISDEEVKALAGEKINELVNSGTLQSQIITDKSINANEKIVDGSITKELLDDNIKLEISEVEKLSSQLDNKANKNEVFSMANMGQDIKEAMTGGSVAVVGKNAVLNDNIVDGQITYNKTNFMGNNIGTNKLKTQSATNDGNKNWFEVYLEKNKTYKLTHENGGYSGCAIDIFKHDKSSSILNLVNWSVFNGRVGVDFNTDNIQTGWYYLRFQVPNQEEANKTKYLTGFQIQEGTVKLPYEDYKEFLYFYDNVDTTKNISNKGISIEKTDFIFNQNLSFTFKDGYTVDENSGSEAPSSTRKGDWTYYEVYPNMTYYFNFKVRIMQYDKNKNYISYVDKANNHASSFYTVPSNVKYIRINVDKNLVNENLVFIPSDEEVTYENAILPTLEQTLLLKKGKKSIFEGKKMCTDGHSIVAQGLWQGYLVNELGVEFIKNCGVGGTSIVNMCSDERVDKIPLETELLLLMAETNDHEQNVPLGNINSIHDNTTYYGAYQLWLDKIYAKIPNATIIIIGSPFKYVEYDLNSHGLILEDYRNATKEIARKYGYLYIDLRGRMNVNYLNYEKFIPDKVHPGMYGAKEMADIIVGDMKRINKINYTIQYS